MFLKAWFITPFKKKKYVHICIYIAPTTCVKKNGMLNKENSNLVALFNLLASLFILYHGIAQL